MPEPSTSEPSTPDRSLDALERLLTDSNASRVACCALAAEAGVSKGGLLHLFPTKEALLAAPVRRRGERYDAQLSAAVAGRTSVANFYQKTYDASDQASLWLFRSIIA